MISQVQLLISPLLLQLGIVAGGYWEEGYTTKAELCDRLHNIECLQGNVLDSWPRFTSRNS